MGDDIKREQKLDNQNSFRVKYSEDPTRLMAVIRIPRLTGGKYMDQDLVFYSKDQKFILKAKFNPKWGFMRH